MAQSYNFFGLGPGQQQAPVDPNILALQQFNNPTSPNAQPSSGGGINPQMLAKMMMQKQQSPTIGEASGPDSQMGYVGDFPSSMPSQSPGLWAQLSGMFGGGNG